MVIRKALVALATLAAAFGGPARAAEVPKPGVPAVQRPMSELKPLAVLKIGKTADWVSIAGGSVWVGSTGPNAVTRIDAGRNAISGVVALPGEPCAGLAQGLGYLWVPLCADKAGGHAGLAKIDLKTGKIARLFAVAPAGGEGGAAVSGDSVWMITDAKGSLARIDPATGRTRQVVRLPAGAFNVAHAGARLYVSQATGAQVMVVDARTGKLLGATPTGPNPRFLSAGADAAWTLNQGDGSVSRIDARSRKPGPTVALGEPGHGGDIVYRDGRVWTTMNTLPLTLTDARNGQVLRQWTGAGGDSLGVSADAIWLTDYRGGTITRYAIADALAR
jgi:virginiamycin B lyase